jgi:hypothetical protein
LRKFVLFCAVLAFIVGWYMRVPSLADCGAGKTPSAADIEAIRFERTNCFGKCPTYEVLFTRDSGCYYVGFQYVEKIGTYGNSCTRSDFKRVVEVVSGHKFFELNYDTRVIVTDVPHYVASVERCGVTTTLNWRPYGERRDIDSLFDAFDAVTNRLRWKKLSDKPTPQRSLLAPIR